MTTALDTLREVAARRKAVEAEYRAALQSARDAGFGGTAIGEAAGTSRQNALALTTAKPVMSVDANIERLAELDARWDRFVDQLAAAMFVDPDAKREQLKRNTVNGKRKRVNARAVSVAGRRGLASRTSVRLIPTVKSDARRAAETYALRFLEDHPLEPACVKVIGELDEAAALREQVSAVTDPVWLHD